MNRSLFWTRYVAGCIVCASLLEAIPQQSLRVVPAHTPPMTWMALNAPSLFTQGFRFFEPSSALRWIWVHRISAVHGNIASFSIRREPGCLLPICLTLLALKTMGVGGIALAGIIAPRGLNYNVLAGLQDIFQENSHDWLTLTHLQKILIAKAIRVAREGLIKHVDILTTRGTLIKMGGDVQGRAAEFHYVNPATEGLDYQALVNTIEGFADASGIEKKYVAMEPHNSLEADRHALGFSIQALAHSRWALHDWLAIQGDSSLRAIAKRFQILTRVCSLATATPLVHVGFAVENVARWYKPGSHLFPVVLKVWSAISTTFEVLSYAQNNSVLTDLIPFAAAFTIHEKNLAIITHGVWPKSTPLRTAV
jgi:hypothetical protein